MRLKSSHEEWPFVKVRVCADGLDPEGMLYNALPSTGRSHVIIPGIVRGGAKRETPNGTTAIVTVVTLITPDRDNRTINLRYLRTEPVEILSGGREERDIFSLMIGVGRHQEKVEAVFEDPGETVIPKVLLGRSFLFRRGCCCFNALKTRLRLSRCGLGRLL